MTEWTWMPTEHLRPHDHHACSSPRAEIKLSPAAVNRQSIQHKRKRSQSHEPVMKKRKCDATTESLTEAEATKHPSTADRPAFIPNAVTLIAPDTHKVKDDRRDSGWNQSGPSSALINGHVDHVHAVPSLEALQSHDSCTGSLPRPSVTELATAPVTTLSRTDHASDTVLQNRTIDRIESQLNLQILSKHNELRLIETEIGKAQIMLEQLRRVRIIPYPGHKLSPVPVENATTGSGLPLKSEPGSSQPQHAPPFGATDGPYSRHYEKWLIRDEAFDPSPARLSRNLTSAPTPMMRKKSTLDDQTPVRQPKRISTSQIVQLPTVTISVDGSPLLVVQREDGEWVKVVCQKCGKQNAANLQGFTNHTRIAHSITYSNHKEAIKECGQKLDEHEATQVSAATSAQASLTPSLPMSSVLPRAGRSSIHPLIFGESLRQSESAQRVVNGLSDSDWRKSLPATPTSASPPVSATSSCFMASPDTPHLSRKLAALDSRMNLHRLVTSSKVRIDLDQVQPLSPDVEVLSVSGSATAAKSNHMGTGQARVPAQEADAPAETGGSRSNTELASVGQIEAFREPPHAVKAYGPSAVVPASFSSESSAATSAAFDFAEEEGDISQEHTGRGLETDDFSPNHSPTTVDTTPGMVSDHDDDSDYMHHSEHGDDAERTREDTFTHIHVRDEQRQAPNTQMSRDIDHQYLATPPSQKKKRGRPRKTDYANFPPN